MTTTPLALCTAMFNTGGTDQGPARLYLRPKGLLAGEAAAEALVGGRGLRLAGGRLVFVLVEAIVRTDLAHVTGTCSVAEAVALAQTRPKTGFSTALLHRLALLTNPRSPFAGVALDRPAIMAIVNVTPDSFSDGGDTFAPSAALAAAGTAGADGADILDFGAESTRPNSTPVDAEAELDRLRPVFAGLASLPHRPPVSIDTRRAPVMAAALAAGATIINDISALRHDPEALPLLAGTTAAAVLMHMQGEPATMQAAPHYRSVVLDVFDFLEQRIAACERAGVPRGRLLVDPGIGFGKTVEHNLALLQALSVFHGLGCGVLVGASRKSWIGRLDRDRPPKERLAGSLAAAVHAWNQGVQVVRVHDPAETVQARAVWQALHPPL